MLTEQIKYPSIRIDIKPGESGVKVMPHSEVCMYMRVAGKLMSFHLLDRQYPMVQLYREDGHLFSSPITTGEAGLFRNENGTYYYYLNDSGVN